MTSLIKKYLNFIPWLKGDCIGENCSSKEGLRKARKQDMAGNYDIDGVSFDGEHLYMSGRKKDADTLP